MQLKKEKGKKERFHYIDTCNGFLIKINKRFLLKAERVTIGLHWELTPVCEFYIHVLRQTWLCILYCWQWCANHGSGFKP